MKELVWARVTRVRTCAHSAGLHRGVFWNGGVGGVVFTGACLEWWCMLCCFHRGAFGMVVHVVLFSLWRVWNGGVCGIVFRRGMLCREDAGSGHEASKLVAKSASFTGRQDRPIRICTDASKKKQQLRGGEERRGEGKRGEEKREERV